MEHRQHRADPAAVTPPADGDQDICGATTPSIAPGHNWMCSAAHGHDGHHAAWGSSDIEPCHAWPQERTAPAALAPQARRPEDQCGAVRVRLGGGRYFCLAAAGHPGDHVPYGALDLAAKTWPQSPPTLISDVGTLTPAEASALAFARQTALDNEYVSPELAQRLVEIIDRLAGITQ